MSTVNIVRNYDELSIITAERLISIIKKKPNAVVCLAGGNSPTGFFKQFVKRVKALSLSLDAVTFIGLDEWVGFNEETIGSCRNTLNEHVFHPLNINTRNIIFFEGTKKPIESECNRVLSEINRLDSIDFILLGVGVNGHIGFNEPNVPMDKLVHVVELDDVTINVSGRKLKTKNVLLQGVTLGMKLIISAEEIVVIASGRKKAPIIKKAIEGITTNEVPVSLLRDHHHVEFIIDQAAGKELTEK